MGGGYRFKIRGWERGDAIYFRGTVRDGLIVCDIKSISGIKLGLGVSLIGCFVFMVLE